MTVLVTGASGFIGAAIARALRAHGHRVLGLARSPASATLLRAAGIEPVPGSLEQPDQLRAAADSADAVVHAAFARYGVDDMEQAATGETTGVRAMLTVLGDRPFIYTSGLGIVGDTGERTMTEDDPVTPPSAMAWRRQLELDTLRAAHGIVIRPPLVYGRADGFVLNTLIAAAVDTGAARYQTPGDNAWPNVHVDDLGQAFALALRKAPPETVLNLVGGQSTPRQVAEAISRLIGIPQATTGYPIEQARDLVPFADWLTTHQNVDPSKARALLGWRPTQPSIIEDIEFGSYRALLPETHHGT